jgi:hypothetical protein
MTSVAIVSGYILRPDEVKYPRWLKCIKKNHQNYAKKHGYHYVFNEHFSFSASKSASQDPEYLISWSKPSFILDLFDAGYEYVFWINPNSIFTNFSRDLSDLMEKCGDFIFTNDEYASCSTSHLFFKKTAYSRSLLSNWDGYRFLKPSILEGFNNAVLITEEGYWYSDQESLSALLASEVDLKELNPSNNIFLVDRRRFNPLPIDCRSMAYQFGDPIVYFGGSTKRWLKNANLLHHFFMRYGIYIPPLSNIFRGW